MSDIAARVLIVDDEEDIRTSIAALLRRALPGKRVIVEEAASYEQAMAIADRTPKDSTPLLVLSDFNLKAKKTGLDVLDDVGRKFPAAKRVLMTAYLLSDFGVDASRVKLDAFLRKPVSPPAFSDLLAQVVAGSLGEAPQRKW